MFAAVQRERASSNASVEACPDPHIRRWLYQDRRVQRTIMMGLFNDSCDLRRLARERTQDDCLTLAAALRAEVEQIDGFIAVERSGSLHEEGKLMSLQFWRNEEAITRWRTHLQHRPALAGRSAGVLDSLGYFKAHIEIAARGIGIRADLMGLVHKSLSLRPVDPRENNP